MSLRSIIGALAVSLSFGCASSSRTGYEGSAADRWPVPPAAQAADVGAPSLVSLPESGAEGLIGPGDLLAITVLEATELSRSLRVSGEGTISVPLLGEVRAEGLTPRKLELDLEQRFRGSFILDPHVSVQVSEIQSRPVSVLGAVNRPGVLQIRGTRSLLEVLALAGGLTEEAGDDAFVVRAPSPQVDPAVRLEPEIVKIPLHQLLAGGTEQHNVPIYPGDVVKVQPAGLIYVVGEVNKPGAFPLQRGSGLTVLQAIALGSGLRPLAAKGRTVIIRTTASGERTEIAVDVGAVLSGKAADPSLQPRDVVFVPNSTVKVVTLGVVDALMRMVTLRGIF